MCVYTRIHLLFIYLFEGDYSISQHSYEKWMKVPMKKIDWVVSCGVSSLLLLLQVLSFKAWRYGSRISKNWIWTNKHWVSLGIRWAATILRSSSKSCLLWSLLCYTHLVCLMYFLDIIIVQFISVYRCLYTIILDVYRCLYLFICL